MSAKREKGNMTVLSGIVSLVLVLCVSAESSRGAIYYVSTDDIFSNQKVVEVMRKVHAYQLTHPWKEHDRNWIRATYYTGVMALYETTRDPKILDQAVRWAEKHQWAEGNEREAANKKTCGQTYLQLYFLERDPARIAKIRAYVDRRIEEIENGEPPRKGWYYCDTLYVGPPTIAMLGKATGEQKYYDYLNRVYWDVTDHLFDKQYGLFYRDKRYFDAKTANGKKVFWSRGNGWVIGGIPRVLEYLPKGDAYYDRYVELLRTMATSITKVQGDDGLWRTNLADADEFPGPETSGSAFFCYAMTWGINNEFLDSKKYLPVVMKAWEGLVRNVQPDGKLGYVQRVASAPGLAARDDTHEYAMGLFLLAGSEIVKLIESGSITNRSRSAKEADRDGAGEGGKTSVGATDAKPLILRSEYARWRDLLPEDYPQVADYRRVMLRWVTGAEQSWGPDPERPELGTCRFGQQKHTHVRTARSLPVYAALAADSELDDPVWTRSRLADRLNAAIAFLCATYDPSGPCEGYWSKKPWPNSLRYETWVIGNMLDVLQITPELVVPENKQRIREILVDIIEDERQSSRAESLDDYRHEGITWTINLLARGAVLYPDHPQADQWLDLAKHGYASSLSVEADLKDETVVDGKPIKEWVAHRCPVFYPDFTFTHHALGIHPGYMAIAGHRMVSLYDMLKRSDTPLSPVWYHHFRDMMAVLKGLALWDGRVAFPNAKDWADYIYGVCAIRFGVVGLQMMFGDREARLIEQGLFRQLEWLQLKRGRGDFGPSNAEYIHNVNDAKSIGFAYWLHQAHGFIRPASQGEFDRAHSKVFHSPYSKFIYVRDPSRFASWGWQACRNRATGKVRSTGLILPCGHNLGDHLAQWDDNLVPDYWTADERGHRSYLQVGSKNNHVETFPGGFAVSERTELHLPNDKLKPDARGCVIDHRVMVAIPDGRTVVFAASGRAAHAVSRLGTMDVNWRFVRSAFSDMQRTIYHEGGQKECRHVTDVSTPWFNIDGIISVVSIGKPALVTCELFGKVDGKGIPVAQQDPFGMHAGQTVRLGVCSLAPRDYQPGQEVFTACLAFVTDTDAAKAGQLVRACREAEVAKAVHAYHVRGRDGKPYLIIVNFSDSATDVEIPGTTFGQLLTPRSANTTMKSSNNLLLLHIVPRGCALLVPR